MRRKIVPTTAAKAPPADVRSLARAWMDCLGNHGPITFLIGPNAGDGEQYTATRAELPAIVAHWTTVLLDAQTRLRQISAVLGAQAVEDAMVAVILARVGRTGDAPTQPAPTAAPQPAPTAAPQPASTVAPLSTPYTCAPDTFDDL